MSTAQPQSPRVCILLESYVPVVGGMETQARNLGEGLAQAGIPVLFVTRRADRAWKAVDAVDGLPVYRVPPVGRNSRLRWVLVLTCLPALVRLRREYDVLLVSGFRTLGLAAVFAGRLLGKPVILKAESRGELSGEFFTGGLARLKLKRSAWPVRRLLAARNAVLRRAQAFISLSAEMCEEYRQAGVPPERVHLIANSVDLQRFRPAAPGEQAQLRAKLGLPADGLLAIFTGRLVSYKGLPVLVRAWERLAGARAGARLLLVGAGGVDVFNCEDELRRTVAERGLQDAVRFTGSVSNVEEYLRAADVFVLPTENEAFPLALLEAMACGLPAVATGVGGLKDVVTDGVNGLMIPPALEDPLAAALQRLLGDAALRAELGRAALATVRERYTRERVTAQYRALFARVLEPGPEGRHAP